MSAVICKKCAIKLAIFVITWISSVKCTGQVTTKCGSDVIEVIIPKQLVVDSRSGQPVLPQLIMFSDDASEHCRAEEKEDANYAIKLRIKSKFICGAKMKVIDKSTWYTGSIVWLDTGGNMVKPLANFTCLYKDNEHIFVLPETNRRRIVTLENTSKVQVNFDLYRDKTFTTSALFDDITPTILVGQNVFVSINASNNIQSSKRVSVFADKCFASFYPHYNDGRIMHTFLEGGCGYARDSTVQVFHNGNSSSSQWKFQMFKWLNVTAQKVYLFCDVLICNEDSCSTRRNCSYHHEKTNPPDGKRESNYIIMAIGPIFPKDSEILLNRGVGKTNSVGTADLKNPIAGDPNIIPIVVGTLSGFCLVIVVIASVIMYRRRKQKRRQKKAQENEDKNKIEQGFAFAITSSNDQNLYANEQESTSSKDDGNKAKKTKSKDGKKVERSRSDRIRSKIIRSASVLSRKNKPARNSSQEN